MLTDSHPMIPGHLAGFFILSLDGRERNSNCRRQGNLTSSHLRTHVGHRDVLQEDGNMAATPRGRASRGDTSLTCLDASYLHDYSVEIIRTDTALRNWVQRPC